MSGAWREQAVPRLAPHRLLRAGQPQFSALWWREWLEQLAPCGPPRRRDLGGRPLGRSRPREGGLRAGAGAARGKPGSSSGQVGAKDRADARRGRASAEAVRARGGL